MLMPNARKAAVMLAQVQNTVQAHHRQAAAVIAENDQHVVASTGLILESRALLARVDRLLNRHPASAAPSPAAL
jgi:hypothetical protein